MHRIQRHEYVGQPGESVRVTTITHGGGRVRLTLDGQDLGSVRTFPLSNAGAPDRNLKIELAGPLGASCGVGIAVVDSGTDGDFLLCQAVNPMPSSDYTFKVAASASVTAFGVLKGSAAAARSAAKAGAKGKRKSKKSRGKNAPKRAKKGGK